MIVVHAGRGLGSNTRVGARGARRCPRWQRPIALPAPAAPPHDAAVPAPAVTSLLSCPSPWLSSLPLAEPPVTWHPPNKPVTAATAPVMASTASCVTCAWRQCHRLQGEARAQAGQLGRQDSSASGGMRTPRTRVMLLAPDPEMMMMPRMASAAWLAPQGPRALGAGAGAALLP